MITYKNEWGEGVNLYVEDLPIGIKFTFSKKNRCDIFCVPHELKDELLNLINNIGGE